MRHRPFKPREDSTEAATDIPWGTVNDGSLPPIAQRAQTERRAPVPKQRNPNKLGRPSDDVLKVLGDNITYLREEIKRARRTEKHHEAEFAERLRQKDAVLADCESELAAVREEAGADRARLEHLEHENRMLQLAVPRAVAVALENAEDERAAEVASIRKEADDRVAAGRVAQAKSMVAAAVAAACEVAADDYAPAPALPKGRLSPAVDVAALALISRTPGNNYVAVDTRLREQFRDWILSATAALVENSEAKPEGDRTEEDCQLMLSYCVLLTELGRVAEARVVCIGALAIAGGLETVMDSDGHPTGEFIAER